MTRLRSGFGNRIFAVGVLLALLLPALIFGSTVAQTDDPSAVDSALEWLDGQQLDNGGYPGFDGEANLSATTDVTLAYAAAEVDPDTVTSPAGVSLVDFLIDEASVVTMSPGQAAKLLLALHASNVNLSTVEPNPVTVLLDGYDQEAALYDPSFYNHALAVLALSGAGEQVPESAIDTILESQISDGSWSFAGPGEPGDGDSNTTSIAIQALVAADAGANAIDQGVQYLYSVQADDASFAYDLSEAPEIAGDANSTALTIQALIAADEDPTTSPNGDAIAALEGFQNPSGSFFWRADAGTEDNLLATVQAIPALLGKPLPIDPLVTEPADPAPGLEAALKPADPVDGCVYFEATSHNLCDNFSLYWEENGGLKIFGYPLTEPYEEGDATVQYFERARLEWRPGVWPENHDILQGRLGAELLEIEIAE